MKVTLKNESNGLILLTTKREGVESGPIKIQLENVKQEFEKEEYESIEKLKLVGFGIADDDSYEIARLSIGRDIDRNIHTVHYKKCSLDFSSNSLILPTSDLILEGCSIDRSGRDVHSNRELYSLKVIGSTLLKDGINLDPPTWFKDYFKVVYKCFVQEEWFYPNTIVVATGISKYSDDEYGWRQFVPLQDVFKRLSLPLCMTALVSIQSEAEAKEFLWRVRQSREKHGGHRFLSPLQKLFVDVPDKSQSWYKELMYVLDTYVNKDIPSFEGSGFHEWVYRYADILTHNKEPHVEVIIEQDSQGLYDIAIKKVMDNLSMEILSANGVDGDEVTEILKETRPEHKITRMMLKGLRGGFESKLKLRDIPLRELIIKNSKFDITCVCFPLKIEALTLVDCILRGDFQPRNGVPSLVLHELSVTSTSLENQHAINHFKAYFKAVVKVTRLDNYEYEPNKVGIQYTSILDFTSL